MVDLPLYKKQKINNEIEIFKIYIAKQKSLLNGLGDTFNKAYMKWLIYGITGVHQPVQDINFNKILIENVDIPLKRFAEEELRMNDDVIARAKIYMTRPEFRSESVEAIIKQLTDIAISRNTE